jgi:RHS repeat-associated protein
VTSIETVEHPFRFPGQYYDKETGLHYNYFRDYNPKTGRYLTPDPIGLAGGINPYAYVANNPINFIDPLGLKCKKGFWERSCENFKTTNEVIPGILAPPLMGFLTGGKMAEALGSITMRQWASMGFRGAVLGGAAFTVLETGVVVAGTAAVNFAYVALAWETGVAIGSIISAAIMPCEEEPPPPCR